MKIGKDTERKIRTEIIIPLAVFAAVTVFMMYPVSLQPGSLVRGRPFEDAFESIWFLHWYKEALFDLHVSPLFQPDIFYPLGWDLRFAILPPLHPILLAPLTALTGHVAAYNLSVMAACVLAAFGTFRLARLWGADFWAGLLAGVAFAFYPERQVALDGHLNFLLASLWIPWMVYGIVKADRQPQTRTWWLAFAGLAYSLSITAAWPFVFITTVALLVFGLVYLAPTLREQWRDWIRPLSMALLVTLVVAGPWMLQGVQVRQGIGASAEFPFQNINRTSVGLEAFLIPSRLNPPLWNLFQEAFPTIAQAAPAIVNFGYLVTLLALLGLVHLRLRQRMALSVLALTLVSLVLMLGPTLHLLGSSLSTSSPFLASVAGRIAPELVTADGRVLLPMPAFLLYKLVPPFRSFHGFDRWGMIASLGMGLLAAFGLTRLRAYRSLPFGLIGAAALALVMLEYNPLPHTYTSTAEMHRDVDDWLAAQPQQNVIVEYPLVYTMKGQSLYYTIAHRQKIVHGYSSIPPAGFAERLATLRAWPSAQTLDMLQQIGTRYVLVEVYAGDDTFESETLPQLRAKERLDLIRVFNDSVGPIGRIYVFELARDE